MADDQLPPLWLFKGQYRALREAVERGADEFTYRPLAAELRGLLVDAQPIADAANRKFHLTIEFAVRPAAADAGYVARPGGGRLNESLLAGPPDASTGSRSERLSRDAFLRLPAARLPDGSTFSLRDAVVAGANIAGSIHGAPRGAEGDRLKPLAAALFGPEIDAGRELLAAVARHVLAAYRHLFTLADGASLGLAQLRPEYQPWFRGDPAQDAAVTEFTGAEFFEDGLPDGLRSHLTWFARLALGLPDAISDRHVLDIGIPGKPGPRFSVVQRSRSILARFTTGGGEVVETRPVRLMHRRFYAVAAGMTETAEGRVRTFVRLWGAVPLSVDALGPPGVGIGQSEPSRMTIGAGLDRGEAKAGRGALMQLEGSLFYKLEDEGDLDKVLESLSWHSRVHRWLVGPYSGVRLSFLYNQARNASGDQK